MNSLRIGVVCLLVILYAEAFQWKVWETNGQKMIRTLNVVKQPPQFPYTYEVRASERTGRTWRGSLIKDAVDFIISVDKIPHYTVRHFDKDTDNVEKRAARHGLRKLVEYIKAPGATGAFNPDNDTIVQHYYLWNQTWTPLRVTPMSTAGASVTSICSNTVDNVVELCAFVADLSAPLMVNGSTMSVDNNAIHHTLKISNFPFRSANSRLALKVHYESVTKEKDVDKTKTSSDEDGADLSADGDSIKPVAAWKTTVDVKGNGCSATAAVVRDIFRDTESTRDVDVRGPTVDIETSLTIVQHITYFSYLTDCQPATIFWDPDLGINDNTSAAMSFIPSLLLITAILAYFLH